MICENKFITKNIYTSISDILVSGFVCLPACLSNCLRITFAALKHIHRHRLRTQTIQQTGRQINKHRHRHVPYCSAPYQTLPWPYLLHDYTRQYCIHCIRISKQQEQCKRGTGAGSCKLTSHEVFLTSGSSEAALRLIFSRGRGPNK